MADKEPVSILTASTKIHYIAIGIFVILFAAFYVFAYTDQFKNIRGNVEKWGTYFSNAKTNHDIAELDDTLDEDSDSDDYSDNKNEINMRDILSPF